MTTDFIRNSKAVAVTGLILALVAVSKTVEVFQSKPYLQLPDVVLPFLLTQHLLVLAIVFEGFTAALIFFSKNQLLKAVLLGWLGFTFLTYHAFSSVNGNHLSCACLGYFLSGLKLDPIYTNLFAITLALWFALQGILLGKGVVDSRNCPTTQCA